MAMAGWQRHVSRVVLKVLSPASSSSRALHSESSAALIHSCRVASASNPILFPISGADRAVLPGAQRERSEDGIVTIRNPFMELMAVPKRKVTPSRKGKRNGPKALKPIPVVAKCKVCGRIKLPHFYCCSGEVKG